MFLEVLCSLNQIVPEMNKSLFGYRTKCILNVTVFFLVKRCFVVFCFLGFFLFN